MNADQKNEFTSAYTQALVKSWGDDAYAARLENDTAAALAEVGITLPQGAHVAVVRHVSEGPIEEAETTRYLDQQASLFEKGQETGYFEFHLPAAPQVQAENLDEVELSGIAGGFEPCCCCCSC